MTNKPESPRAFPLDTDTFINQGMTLRDYFAAAALTGLMTMRKDRYLPEDVPEALENAAYCYHIADAFLEQREK